MALSTRQVLWLVTGLLLTTIAWRMLAMPLNPSTGGTGGPHAGCEACRECDPAVICASAQQRSKPIDLTRPPLDLTASTPSGGKDSALPLSCPPVLPCPMVQVPAAATEPAGSCPPCEQAECPQSVSVPPPVPSEVIQAPLAPIHVVYHHSPFHWEFHLDHWLKGLARPARMVVDKTGELCIPQSIVVVNHLSVTDARLDPNAYFERCAARGITSIGAFHTGDLDWKQSYGYYHQARFVYRNHYPSRQTMHERNMPEKKLRLMPLGSKFLPSISMEGFAQTIGTKHRKHFCSFVGALNHSPTRKAMADGLQQHGLISGQATYVLMEGKNGACTVYFSSSDWNDKRQMTPWEYRNMLADSVFSLVPLGRGPDSFRLYEALELGSIPIITDIESFTLPLGPNHPLPLVSTNDWGTKLPQLLRQYYADPETVAALQRRVVLWWMEWKNQFKARLSEDVEALFD